MRSTMLLALLLLAPLADAIAQDLPLQRGQRVRVTASTLGMERQTATFQALERNTLVVRADTTMRCPLSAVTRLEAVRGQRGHPWRGAGIGFLAGAGVGAIVGAAAHDFLGQDLAQGQQVWAGAAIFSASGAAIGALLGAAAFKTDRWEDVPLNRLNVSVAREQNGRLGIGVRVAF